MFDFFKRKHKTMKYTCVGCGEEHEGLPAVGYKRPRHYFDVPESEREDRVLCDSDFCVIQPSEASLNQHVIYMIRTELHIPVQEMDEYISLGVWVSQSKESFELYCDTFETDQSDFLSFGWLTVHMPYYKTLTDEGNLISLKCDVNGRGNNQRPLLHIQKTDHPLYYDTHDGVSLDRAYDISSALLHP